MMFSTSKAVATAWWSRLSSSVKRYCPSAGWLSSTVQDLTVDAVNIAGRTHGHGADQHATGESKQHIGALRGQVAAVGRQDLRTVQDGQEGIGPPARGCR